MTQHGTALLSLPMPTGALGSAAPGSAGPEQLSGLTRPISGEDSGPLVTVFLTRWEMLPVRPGRLEAALSMGPSELFLGLGILVKAEKCPHQLPGFGTHTGTGARSSQEMRCSGCTAKGAGPLPRFLLRTSACTWVLGLLGPSSFPPPGWWHQPCPKCWGQRGWGAQSLSPQVEQQVGLLVEDHFDVAGADQVIVHLIPLPIAGLWKMKGTGSGCAQGPSWHEEQRNSAHQQGSSPQTPQMAQGR